MRIFKALGLVVSLFAISNLYGQKSIDVQHYKFQITLNDDNDTIRGKATITTKFLTKSDQLVFDLKSIHKAKGMQVVNVVTD